MTGDLRHFLPSGKSMTQRMTGSTSHMTPSCFMLAKETLYMSSSKQERKKFSMWSTSSSLRETGRGKQLLILLQKGFAINWPLMFCGLVMLVVLLASLVGIVVDPRIITGMPAWVKPAKFAISISVYSFTLLWFLHFIQGHKRLVSFLANSIAAALFLEMLWIAGQAMRGTTSHFNNATPFDTTLWRMMGVIIGFVFLLNMVAVVLLLLQRMTEPVLAWSLRLGSLLSIVGMAVAFLMTQPTAIQMAALHAGVALSTVGAHSVGVVDGGPGLPILGWSTSGGDLRIPHFVGLHALQMLPLFGWLLGRRSFVALSVRRRVALVWVFALAYLGLIGLLTWQALRAQPLLAPDALTLQACAALLVGTVLSMVSCVFIGRSRTL